MKLVMIITAITMFLHICGGALVNARALSKCKINKKEIALGFIVCLAVSFFVFNVQNYGKNLALQKKITNFAKIFSIIIQI